MTDALVKERIRFGLAFLLYWTTGLWLGRQNIAKADCIPPTGCSVALAYYTVVKGDTVDIIAARFQTTREYLQKYNVFSNVNSINTGEPMLIPFECECGGDQLGYNLKYTVASGDNLTTIVQNTFQNLSRTEWVEAANNVNFSNLSTASILDIPLNCSCGNPDVSSQYGLFATYVAENSDTPATLSTKFGISSQFLTEYNRDLDLDNLIPNRDIIFVPEKDLNGVYPSFNNSGMGSGGTSMAAIVGASVGGAILLIIGLGFLFFCFYLPNRRKVKSIDKQEAPFLTNPSSSLEFSGVSRPYSESTFSNASIQSWSPGLANLALDKSFEYSYQELAAVTDNFSDANKIGAGGFGAVYYGELHGQRLAIKMMDMLATKEFLAELKVLTHVHHTNLVQLVGYCTTDSLFLIYEFVDNGTLSHHLKASGREGSTPLPWTSRVQIALDAARGLEYIHEHTTPTYIHRDIKPANILIDRNFRAKVADFGLTKLTEAAGTTKLAGTFGYMAPEYASFGEVSPKADVYSFGVVLFEIISAKEAIVHTVEVDSESNLKSLVTLFENVLNDTNGKEKLSTLIDPALGDNYPLDSVWKMAQVARACTKKEPDSRPNMRAVVGALMTLSSSTQEWDFDSYSADYSIWTPMPGRD